MRLNRSRFWLVVAAAALAVAGCSSKKLVVELHGSVMYEKPGIMAVSHTLSDTRPDGGAVVVRITVHGDPGLEASFDIAPDIAERHPMIEETAGTYVGEFAFPPDTVGGPFTIVGRVAHEQAGEVDLRDPESVIVTRVRPGS